RPEVEDDGFAAVIRQLHGLAIKAGEFEIGCRLVDERRKTRIYRTGQCALCRTGASNAEPRDRSQKHDGEHDGNNIPLHHKNSSLQFTESASFRMLMPQLRTVRAPAKLRPHPDAALNLSQAPPQPR